MCRYRAAALAAVCLLFAGCGGSSAPNVAVDARPAKPFPVTLTDDEGVKVTLKSSPKRIVTFAPANTEILFALGLRDRLVGVSGPYDDFPPAARRITEVGGATGVQPNAEKVISLQPDLLLATSGGETWKDRLRSLGVPVFTIDATTLRDVFHDIDTIGRLTGVSRRARVLTNGLEARAADTVRRVSADARVSCFYEVYYQPPVYSVGPGSFVFDLLTHAGCNPVTADLKRAYPQLSVEAVVRDDPEVYLVDSLSASSPSAVGRRPGFDALSAVRHHRVAVIDSDLVTRPGPRVVRGLRDLAEALHPESFE
jgi:iron complex transport system substrate-binding protein